MFFWNSLTFSMIQQMLAIGSLVPLPLLNPASANSEFMYCWSLSWSLSSTLLVCEMSAIVWLFEHSLAIIQLSSVQSLSCVWLFVTPWIAACQASLSITISWSSLKLTSIRSVMPSSRLILCRPLLLLPSITPSIRVFSNESTLCMRWPKYWSFSFRIIPSKEHPGLISFRMDWLDLFACEPWTSRCSSWF